MARGIVGLVGLAATLVFAIPVAYLGVDMLVSGRLLVGAGFLGLAALMLAVEEYLTTPGDVPGKIAARVVGSVAVEPDSDEE
jgi:hypothetical protein